MASEAQLHDVDWSTLPAPVDDGAADHLQGSALPALLLPSTDGRPVDLSSLSGRTVLYIYPMTGTPGTALPDGWDAIPGARGCTPQSCGFRDHHNELCNNGVSHVFGLSSQTTDEQSAAAQRLHLPFALLSDESFRFTDALRLPTFEADGRRLLKRMAMVMDVGRISKVFYPVFPPDRSARDVLSWLMENA